MQGSAFVIAEKYRLHGRFNVEQAISSRIIPDLFGTV
jgi:hypothetical protein